MCEIFKCSKCEAEKPRADFPHAKGARHSWCRACHKVAKDIYRRKFREANPRKRRISSEIVAGEGRAVCSKCKEERDISLFQIQTTGPSGQCRICKTASEKARRERAGIPVKKLSRIEGDQKLCLCCDLMKPMTEFSPTTRGSGGVSAYCRPCFNEKFTVTKEEACKATAEYRARHPERHKAMHRVRMFEYRAQKKVTADGSVTDAFLNDLYAQEICCYCEKQTPRDKRTADHRVALAKDGTHTADNLVMACVSCNSSKRDLSEEDFFKRIRGNV